MMQNREKVFVFDFEEILMDKVTTNNSLTKQWNFQFKSFFKSQFIDWEIGNFQTFMV